MSFRKSISDSCLYYHNVRGGKIITSGTYGLVKNGIIVIDERSVECVLKVVDNEDCFDTNEFLSEVYLMRNLKHKNIVRIYGYFNFSSVLFKTDKYVRQGILVLEKCKTKNLYDHLIVNDLTTSEKLKYTHQILDGVIYIHSLDIVHRDIKLNNILFGYDGNLKICDFGNSIHVNCYENKLVGTTEFIAPEVINGSVDDPKKADIYSFGILLFHLWTGKVPYMKMKRDPNFTRENLMKKVCFDDLRPYSFYKKKMCHSKVYSLIKKCCEKDPKKRPESFEEIKDNFQKIRFKKS